MSSKKTVIVIAGPTASGKTATAITLAKQFGTAILSADSRQCFKELNIGVAKPTAAELAAAQHYFINSHSIHEQVNAGIYEQYALDKLAIIFKEKDLAIVAGGTGLYLKALCEGIDKMPPIDEVIRSTIINDYHRLGMPWLQREIAAKDPLFWANGEQQNPQRLMRALEFITQTGQSILQYRTQQKATRPFNIIKLALEWDREKLYQRINVRVEQMMAEGLASEVKSLLPQKLLNPLQTVGYKELFDYYENKMTLSEAVEKIKINTRHYAKRQMTWFKKEKDFQWFHPEEKEKILSCIKSTLASWA